MPSERGAGSAGEEGEATAGGSGAEGEPGGDGGAGGDGALEEALKDFDGEILAEREVIRARANETAGNTGGTVSLPESGGTSSNQGGGGGDIPGMPPGGATGDAREGGAGVPSVRGRPPPAGPSVAGSSLPDDIPDAKDDDIIARQLREAAMQETDPELKEKLWDEYRRYKGL
jgi:hypothetical protein